MFAEHTAPFIKQPMLVLNSVYDSWQMGRELPHGYDAAMVNQLGRLVIEKVTTKVLLSNPQSGAFLTGCSEHTTWPNWMSAGVDGMRIPDVITKWYLELDSEDSSADAGVKKRWIGMEKYPCATCCHNYKPPAGGAEAEQLALVE
jgi:hypothetical protein